MKNLRFAIYCRKSTDTEDKQVLSLESQEKELSNIAEREGLRVTYTLTERMSAKDPGRPVFNELISLIRKGKVDAILCWKIDRLTRNPIDAGTVQWLLQTEKIKCIKTFEKPFFPNDNVLLINIEQAMAIQYIRDLSANVKRGNRTKLERGEWPNHAPFGYLNDKGTKSIIVDQKNARYVVQIFRLYSTGEYSLKEISNILFKEGLRTKSGNKVIKSHIHRILSNKFYCGLMERDRKLYQGNHPPLIPLPLFEEAQDILHGRKHPRRKKHYYAVRGFLKCGECGCALTADMKKGYTYYYCTNGKGNCEQHKKYLRSERVEALIAEILRDLHFPLQTIELCYKSYVQKYQTKEDHSNLNLEKLYTEQNALQKKESLLVDGYTSEMIREDIYRAKMLELENKHAELKVQISQLQKAGIPRSATFEQVKNVFIQGNKASKLFLQYDNSAKRNHLLSLLSNIYIKDQNILSYQFKSPFDVLAKASKSGTSRAMLAAWDTIGSLFLDSEDRIAMQNKGPSERVIRESG